MQSEDVAFTAAFQVVLGLGFGLESALTLPSVEHQPQCRTSAWALIVESFLMTIALCMRQPVSELCQKLPSWSHDGQLLTSSEIYHVSHERKWAVLEHWCCSCSATVVMHVILLSNGYMYAWPQQQLLTLQFKNIPLLVSKRVRERKNLTRQAHLLEQDWEYLKLYA